MCFDRINGLPSFRRVLVFSCNTWQTDAQSFECLFFFGLLGYILRKQEYVFWLLSIPGDLLGNPSNDGKNPSFAAMLIPVKNMGFFPSQTKFNMDYVHSPSSFWRIFPHTTNSVDATFFCRTRSGKNIFIDTRYKDILRVERRSVRWTRKAYWSDEKDKHRFLRIKYTEAKESE
jgi:hypothetical protein